MNIKHAYLIIAHNEFLVLQKLIDSLDDERIDIYVLFDKKVLDIPNLFTKKAGLKILDNRINIYWGDFSLVQAGLLLFKAVANKNYSYCHLISGVHLPLYSQDYLHEYFQKNYPKQVFSPIAFSPTEVNMRLKLRSFFIKYYKHPNPFISRYAQYAWVAALKVQKLLHIKRDRYKEYCKFSNWVSITQEAVNYLIDNEKSIKKNFKYAFCGDEFYVPTTLKNANIPFEFSIDDRLLYQNFENTNATVIEYEEFNILMERKSLFGRKFSAHSMDIVDKIMENYKYR